MTSASPSTTPMSGTGVPAHGNGQILNVAGLKTYFPIRSRGLLPRTIGMVKAVDGIDMTLEKGYMDQDEKVYVRDLLVEKGQAAIAPIRRFLKV